MKLIALRLDIRGPSGASPFIHTAAFELKQEIEHPPVRGSSMTFLPSEVEGNYFQCLAVRKKCRP